MKIVMPLVSEARGSMAGLTASRNHYGQYFKGKSSPVNPSSSRQQAVRASFADLAGDWNELLSPAQRTAWNLYGSQVVFTNPLGQQYVLTGYSHYQRSNGARLAAGLTRVIPGPTDFTLPSADDSFAASISEAAQEISVTFNDALGWCDLDETGMLIYQGTPQNPGRTYLKSATRFADVIAGSVGSPPTSPTTVACPFVCTEGQVVEVLARLSLDDGRLSSLFRCTVSVAA